MIARFLIIVMIIFCSCGRNIVTFSGKIIKKKVQLIFLSSSFICFSCIHSDTIKNDYDIKLIKLPYIINLEKNLSKKQSISLSSIGKKIEYIPLETTPNSVIRRIDQIVICDSFIFINDFNKLHQFDRNGKYVRQVGANGRGPGEYTYVSGFCINNLTEKVYIIAWGAKAVLEFDFHGRYLRSFKKPFDSALFLQRDINKFIFYLVNTANITNDSDYSWYITDFDGTPLVKIRNYHKRIKKPTISIGRTPLYFYRKTVRLKEFGVDTLYILNNRDLEPYAVFNLGKKKMDSNPVIPLQNPGMDEAINALDQKLWIDKINENERYLFLKLNLGLSDSMATCIFDKITLETTFLEKSKFNNDIDGGMNFWPRFIFNDSILVDYCEANILIKNSHNGNTEELKKKYGEKYTQLEKLASELDETSNPILIILKSE